MPHTIETRKRAYQKMQSKRQQWLKENGPCKVCLSWENLEVDHIDRKTKVTHKVWSWREEKRQEELKKCQVLCKKCHQIKTKKERFIPIPHGSSAHYRRGCRCNECSVAFRLSKNEERRLRVLKKKLKF